MTGKTFEKTLVDSARYVYRMRVSFSSVEYLTRVARTVSTSAWTDTSVRTSGSRRTLFSFETDTRVLRSCTKRHNAFITMLYALSSKSDEERKSRQRRINLSINNWNKKLLWVKKLAWLLLKEKIPVLYYTVRQKKSHFLSPCSHGDFSFPWG